MTNHWIDIRNARLIMVLGANPCENHPVVWQYINEAKAAGAKMVVADPRRTRTATQADVFSRIRPGTNGALIQGLINYAITNNRYAETYISEKIASRTFWGVRSDSGADEKTGITATNGTQNGVLLGGWPKWTDATFKLNAERTDYERADVTVTLTGPDRTVTFAQMPVVLSDWKTNPDSVFNVLKDRAAHYTPEVVADICDIPGGAAGFEQLAMTITDPATHGKGTILYAMGGTQYTHAAQDLRAYSMLQLVLGNMGMAGGGVNALRGIHNVQGSTDMGVLFSSMPGYSDVPGEGVAYGTYVNKLFGNPKGTAAPYWSGLQQVGFRNMMWHYFRQGADPVASEYDTGNSNSSFDLMPKGNGLNHLAMFANARAATAEADRIKCMFVFGQNPAVTEPNLTLVKEGLRDLDTLIVTDVFESETAGCDRKETGVTYLLPSASFVEEEGSITNSGRWIQWRYKAIDPQGNTKSDTEILLTLADKLATAGAFSHIPGGSYATLYGSQYGWTPGSDFNAVAPAVAENIFKQLASDQTTAGDWGALWIYRGAYHNSAVADWGSSDNTKWTNPNNKAKSRSTWDTVAGKGIYPCWGWSWLNNRRVFYNNGSVAGDQADLFVAPDSVARFFVHSGIAGQSTAPAYVSYSWFYRSYSTLKDADGGDGSVYTAGAGARMPKHWEPHETPREDLRTKYGVTGDAPTTARGQVTSYPMVLTTIRVTEHFQGGPTTRNIPWLCELVPEPFIELNSADAAALGIVNGDNVYIDSARAVNAGPFKAVVGSGAESSQRVKKGVAAIPWHWGNKGISTGESANTVTIDALDMNIKMPEYKACLCAIHK
jgi:formate dehydrogenase major subunit